VQLVCPAGNLPSLKAAIDEGADVVYLGFRDETNARNFAGLNFDDRRMAEGLDYVRERGRGVYLALNTYPGPRGWQRWQAAVDRAADLGVDALIAADLGVLDYAARTHPRLNLHLSVQGSATNYEALKFYHEQFGIRRAVLPRVLSMSQVEHLIEHSPVEIEVFGFGSLCIMVEGRCLLSSYAAGQSPNTHGCCSPAGEVRYQETAEGLETRLGGVLVDRVGKGESAGYPTICKGRYEAMGRTYYALEEPTSLNTVKLAKRHQHRR
jgi:putative protease